MNNSALKEAIAMDKAIKKIIQIENILKFSGIICFISLFVSIILLFSNCGSIIITLFVMILCILWAIPKYLYWEYGKYSITQMFYTYFFINYEGI